MKTARFEGYYDEAREAFDLLESKLNHDVVTDLEKHKDVVRQLLEQEIIAAYYYQRGIIEASLDDDNQVQAAEQLLGNLDEYRRLLRP